jgi:hypothetical protein
MMTASKFKKRKYADGTEEEAEEALPKKQKMIGDDNGDSSSSSTDDFSSRPEEVVSSDEEKINLSAGSGEKLLIWRGYFDNEDTSDSKKNDSIGNGRDTSDDEEEQFSNDRNTFN